MNVNINLIEKNVIQINGGIAINVDVSVKNVIYVKKILFGILLHAAVKTDIYQVLCMIQQLRVMKLYRQKKQILIKKYMLINSSPTKVISIP